MNFGMFTEFHMRDGKTQADAFDEHFQAVELAEELGFNSVWLAEYHFSPDRSVLSSPLMIASAIAARTKRITIGQAVVVVPLANPLRLAEEVATLDHISKGRLEFGLGRSALTQFYQGYNMDYGETRDRLFEGLEVVMKAWKNETFSHAGEYWTFNNVTVVPKPYQKPHPLTRVAALSADTFPLIGSMGYPTFLLSGRGIDYLDEQMKEYRRAYKEAGHTGPDDVLLRIPAYVAETAEQARSEPEHSTLHQQAYNARVLAGFQVTEEARQQARARSAVSYDEMIEQRLVFGTPEAVVDRLQEYKERLGLSGFILEVNHGGQIPNERVANSMKLLAERVFPKIR
jgi:alkanesulfonate monooxygenase SsuD/methylene tetrahydromethanopterin reductase-like flavin-dependent oxidoreductase (luciferase family)